MIKTLTPLLAAALLFPSLAGAATLELPADARLMLQVIEPLTLDAESPRRDDVLLRPAIEGGTHQLPEYCVVVGDSRLDGDRLRLTAKAITCIRTEGANSEIYSGEISAAAYDSDDRFGLSVCSEGRCELDPKQPFELRLASRVSLEEQENPSEQINIRRRQADGSGVANPIPAERPDPDQR